VYGTLPRQTLPQHSYTYHEHLSRQRSISHLACEGKDNDSLVWL